MSFDEASLESQLPPYAIRTAALKVSVGADQRALEIDLDAYQHGLLTYITVLTAQLQAVQAR